MAFAITQACCDAAYFDDKPVDPARDAPRNDGGRVLDDAGVPVPGQYVLGWARRGTTGGLGDNRADAEEVVRALLTDAVSAPRRGRRRTPAPRSA